MNAESVPPPLLAIENLTVAFGRGLRRDPFRAGRFRHIERPDGADLGIVGESGSGKTPSAGRCWG